MTRPETRPGRRVLFAVGVILFSLCYLTNVRPANCAGGEIDIGLRFFDGTETVKAAVEGGIASSPLRIAKDGQTYGIILVPINHPDASNVHLRLASGEVKAIKKFRPCQIIFVTSTKVQGNFGGVPNAQAKCTQCAQNAGLSGTFKVLLGQSGYPHPKNAVTISGPVCNTRGEIVANSAADFWDGTLSASLAYDEFGNPAGWTWTGFDKTGTFYEDPAAGCYVCWSYDTPSCLAHERVCKTNVYSNGTCNNWTKKDATTYGSIYGRPDYLDHHAFWYVLTSSCDPTRGFYCLQQ